MTEKEGKFCRTCHWGVLNQFSQTDVCIRKVVISRVEGPRIVKLNPHFERSILGGCGPSGRYWQKHTYRERGSLDPRLIP